MNNCAKLVIFIDNLKLFFKKMWIHLLGFVEKLTNDSLQR